MTKRTEVMEVRLLDALITEVKAIAKFARHNDIGLLVEQAAESYRHEARGTTCHKERNMSETTGMREQEYAAAGEAIDALNDILEGIDEIDLGKLSQGEKGRLRDLASQCSEFVAHFDAV